MAGKKKEQQPAVTTPISARAVEGSEGYSAPVKPLKKKNKDRQKIRDTKYIYSVTQPGLPSYAIAQLKTRFNPSDEAVQFATNWSQMPDYRKNQWMYENKQYFQASKLDTKGNWASAPIPVRQEALKSVIPMFEGSEKLKWTKSFATFPDIARATALAIASDQITPKQVEAVSTAVDLIDSTVKVLTAVSDKVRMEEFYKYTPEKRQAMLFISEAIFNDLSEKAAEQTENIADQGNSILNALGFVGGEIWNVLLAANELGQHFGRALVSSRALVSNFEANPFAYLDPNYEQPSFLDAWRATEKNTVDKERLQELKQKYGNLRVKVILDVVQAMHSDNDDALGDIIYKYEFNQEALQIIDEVLLEEERTDLTSELLGVVDTVRTDDLGNMIANRLLPEDWEGKSLAYTAIDKTTNLAGIFFLDPLLVGGKAIQGFRIFKYGLYKNAFSATGQYDALQLRKALERRPVMAELDNIADSVNAWNQADVIARGALRVEMRTKHGKYLVDDAIDAISDYTKGLGRTATGDDIADWITGMDDILALTQGKAPAFELLAAGQPARRYDVYLPHTSRWRNARIKAKLKISQVLSTKDDFQYVTDLVFNPALMQDEIDAIKKTVFPDGVPAEDRAAANILTKFLSDDENIRMLSTTFGVDPSTIRLSWFKGGYAGGAKYGTRGFSPKAMRLKIDRFLRTFEKAPRGGSISIADGADSELIYSWASLFLPRYHARIVSEIWRSSANEGQRRIILAGLSDGLIKAKGIYATTPEQIALIEELVTSSLRGSEQYAQTQRRILIFGDEVEQLAESSARYARAQINELDDLKKQQIVGINRSIAQSIEQRRLARLELQNINYRLKELEKKLKSGEEIEANVRSLSRELADQSRNLRNQIDTIGDELKSLTSQVDSTLKPTVRGTSKTVAQTRKDISKAEREINRRIKSIERSLNSPNARLTEEQREQALDMLDSLRAQKEIYAKAINGEWYFQQKALYARQEAADGNYISLYNPAEYNGRQHALHLWQTADKISLPNLDLIQNFSAKAGLTQKILGFTYAGWARGLTDWWSIGNLYGPRYVQRAGQEDWLGYYASGGSFLQALKGFVTSRSFREARGKKLGYAAEFARVKSENTLIGNLISTHLSADEIVAARNAVIEGNMDLFTELVAKSLSRKQVSTFLSQIDETDEIALSLLASMPEGQRIVDTVAEIGVDLNRGVVVDNLIGADPTVTNIGKFNVGSLRSDLVAAGYQRRLQSGPYTQIALNNANPRSFLLWQRQIQGILHEDGKIGQAVFLALRKKRLVSEAREEAVQRIVAILDDPKTGAEYRKQLSMLNEPGMTSRAFAERYFDDSANYFSRGNDLVNNELINLATGRTKTGAVYGRVFSYVNDKKVYDVSVSKLQTLKNKPESILGKEETSIVVADEKDLMTKAWEPLSESLARVSREPIFFANYLTEFRRMEPLVERYVGMGFEVETARNIVAKSALRRAEDVTISYMDNPRVRSLLAFNVRNVSRYYRATEDFYRRVLRLGKYNPEGIQKLAVSYNVLDHSGYVHTDENGEQYFMYPGTKPLTDAVVKGVNILFGGNASISNPFGFYGKTLMLTPSADPDAWLPTLAGPIAALPLKYVTSYGPLAPLERVLFGPKGTVPTSGPEQLQTELLNALLPGHAIRVLNGLGWGPNARSETDSQWASATRSAMQIMAYNGRLDRVATDADLAEARAEATQIATSVLGLRAVLGFVLPASPQLVTEQNLTNEARELGLRTLRPAYIALLNKYKGDADKATLAWYKLNPKLMPFIVGQTEAGKQLYPSVTEEAGKWIKDNSDVIKKYPQAAPFLFPRAGDFSFDTYNLARSLNLIQGKDIDKNLLELITVRDYFTYTATKDAYEADSAKAATSAQRAAMDAKWKEYQQQKFLQNPFLQQRVRSLSEKSNLGLKVRVLDEFRLMFREIDKNDKSIYSKSAKRIETMLGTFDAAMVDLNGIKGTTTVEDNYKAAIRAKLRQMLKDIAKNDQNAKSFYESLLSPMIGGEEE